MNYKTKEETEAYHVGLAVGCVIAPTVFFALLGVIYTIRWLLY